MPPCDLIAGVSCAWRDLQTASITVRVKWSGMWQNPHHTEAGPLLHITPGTRAFGVGIWPSYLYDVPCLFIGTIGDPGRLFAPMDAAAFNHTDGQPRDITIRSDGKGLRFFVDGIPVKLDKAGYAPFPVPAELRGSTRHGFAVDTHCVDPYSAATTLPAVLEFHAAGKDIDRTHVGGVVQSPLVVLKTDDSEAGSRGPQSDVISGALDVELTPWWRNSAFPHGMSALSALVSAWAHNATVVLKIDRCKPTLKSDDAVTREKAPSLITAADLSTTNRTAFSYEGSWSWLQLSPANTTANPYSLGVLNLLSFRLLWPDLLSATVGGRPCTLDPISAGGYVWRPDIVRLRGSCFGSDEAQVNISLQIAYRSNATICARYTLDKPGNLTFEGRLPPDTSGSKPNAIETTSRTTTGSILEHKHLLAKMEAFSSMLSLNTSLNRYWLLRSDLAESSLMSLEKNGAYHIEATATTSATFCLDELHSAPDSGTPVETPIFDASAATADDVVNGWMAEANLPPGLSRADVRKYGSSWLQFWLNTEHSTTGVLSGGGCWEHDIICPSKSKYAR